MKNKAKKSIKVRIFKVMLMLVVIMFSIIAVSFNLIANKYIDKTSNRKLNEIKNIAERRDVWNSLNGESYSGNKNKGFNHFRKMVESKDYKKKDFQILILW